jgi:UrcA family protein
VRATAGHEKSQIANDFLRIGGVPVATLNPEPEASFPVRRTPFRADEPTSSNYFSTRRRIMSKISDAQMFARFASVLLLGSTFLVGKGFAAQTSAAVPSVTVKFEDLNLNSAAGVKALYKRIHFAAQQVCALPESDINLEVRALELRCSSEAESQAINKVHNNALSAYYAQKTGTQASVMAVNAAQ